MVAVILLGVLGAIPVWPGLNDKGEFLRVGLFK
jgi:hypothetical protein